MVLWLFNHGACGDKRCPWTGTQSPRVCQQRKDNANHSCYIAPPWPPLRYFSQPPLFFYVKKPSSSPRGSSMWWFLWQGFGQLLYCTSQRYAQFIQRYATLLSLNFDCKKLLWINGAGLVDRCEENIWKFTFLRLIKKTKIKINIVPIFWMTRLRVFLMLFFCFLASLWSHCAGTSFACFGLMWRWCVLASSRHNT